MSNPFSIIFGRKPTNYIERIKEQNQIITDFESIPSPTTAYIIIGMRRSGKTVLMSSFKNYFESTENWIVINGNPKDHIFENIANQIYKKAKLKWTF